MRKETRDGLWLTNNAERWKQVKEILLWGCLIQKSNQSCTNSLYLKLFSFLPVQPHLFFPFSCHLSLAIKNFWMSVCALFGVVFQNSEMIYTILVCSPTLFWFQRLFPFCPNQMLHYLYCFPLSSLYFLFWWQSVTVWWQLARGPTCRLALQGIHHLNPDQ